MTSEQSPPHAAQRGRWDSVTQELHALRLTRGDPSFAVLARSLIDQRIREGQSEHEAYIAKSSVHDAFRAGRARINVPLTRELVRVLHGDPAQVDIWMVRARAAATEASPATEVPPPAEAELPSPAFIHGLELMAACLVLNLLGREFVDLFAFPIYLDMAGTAVAAIALGPWRGASVGLATNLIGAIGSGWVSIPFALVNITGALVWGYGVRHFDMGKTLPRFFVLNLAAACACSAVAVPILLILIGDKLRDGHDTITLLVEDTLNSFAASVAFSNLLTSSADKLISGFVALVIITALPYTLRARVPLILANMPPPRSPKRDPVQK